MRLIDADALLDKQECLFMKRHILFHGVTAYTIESAPTIDPETLPIVKELRAQLARVTAERDAAVKDLYAVKACKTCALQFSDDCLLEECFEPCGANLSENTPYKWRGIQEAQDNE